MYEVGFHTRRVWGGVPRSGGTWLTVGGGGGMGRPGRVRAEAGALHPPAPHTLEALTLTEWSLPCFNPATCTATVDATVSSTHGNLA